MTDRVATLYCLLLGLPILGLVTIAALGKTMYHVRLAQDYYDPEKNGERPGQFVGRGAALLGCQGKVSSEAFRRLMRGLHPTTNEPLVQNANSKTRDPAWDIVLSPPKSFSVLRALSTDETIRGKFDAAFQRAAQRTIERIEEITFTRKGKSGRLVPALPIVSAFIHECSRTLDPQHHVHLVVHNIAVTEDGETGAIVSKRYYQWKMALGALFRCDLLFALKEEFPQLAFRQTKSGLEISGVPDEVLRHFSSRRRAIEEELAGMEAETAVAKQFACLKTRDPKEFVPPLVELTTRWTADSLRLGFDPNQIPNILSQGLVAAVDKKVVLDASFETALVSLTAYQSHFSELDLIRHVATAAAGKGISGDDVRQYLAAEINRSTDIERVGTLRGQARFSTPAILAEEKQLLAQAKSYGQEHTTPVTTTKLLLNATPNSIGTIRRWFALRSDQTLSDDQRQAIEAIVTGTQKLSVLITPTGAPKMETFERVREFFSAAGRNVVGIGVTAAHARHMADITNIPTLSLPQFLWAANRDHSLVEKAKHAAKQLVREAVGRRIGLYPYKRTPTLDKNSVVIVDRAEQIGTRDMAVLLRHCQKYDAKLILAGDAERIQSVERGAPFGALARDLPKVELITRPKEKQAAEQVTRIRRGETEQVLKDLAARGHLHVTPSRDEAIEKLVSDWQRNGGAADPATNIIIVNAKAEAARVNRLASDSRGTPAVESVITPSGEKITVGDRVVCTRTSRRYDVENGSLGTVLGVSTRIDALQVELDTGRTVTLPLARFPYIELGYAVLPRHAPQTVNAYLLLGTTHDDRHSALLKFSRASDTTRVYVDRAHAGRDLEELARQLSVDRTKTIATELLQTRDQNKRR